MSADHPTPDSVAVAFVLESSIAVSTELGRFLTEYFPSMVKRLAEAHPGCRLRIALVTYGTADTLPSPLLCKRFFCDSHQLLKDISEHASDLGIGKTNSGGSRGMSALEGIVAAIELFDILRTDQQPKEALRPNVSHIFHLASSHPDSSTYPKFNILPSLDFISWESLPQELKKRNIHLSSIHLRSKISQFADLFTAAKLDGPITPWFKTQPQHAFFLTGFAVLPQPVQKVGKRIADTHSAERTVDAKRPRLSQPAAEASPKISASKPPAPVLPPSVPAIAQSHSLPATTNVPQSLPQPNPASRLPQQQQRMIMERFRSSEDTLKNLQASIKKEEAAGNVEKVQELTQELHNRRQKLAEFMKAYTTYAQTQQVNLMNARQQQAQAQMSMQSHGQSSVGTPAISRAQSSPSQVHNEIIPPNFPLPGTTEINQSSNTLPGSVHTATQQRHNRSASGSDFLQTPIESPNPPQATHVPGLPTGAPRTQMPPGSVVAQMQKMLEQQRQRNPPASSSHPGGSMPFPNQNAMFPESSSTVGVPNMASMQESSVQKSEQPTNKALPVWKGALRWSGTGPAGKKEVHAYVVVSTQSPHLCRSETWPSILPLVPTREQAVEIPDLQNWMKKHKPVLCTFQADPRAGDPKANENYYRMLVQLLTQKKIYATSAWILPNGSQKNNLLVFPINETGLVGAFFPLTGIPEMPKPVQMPSIPPKMLAQLQQLTPEQRALCLQQLAQRQRMLMARQGDGTAGGLNVPVMTQQQPLQAPHPLDQHSFGANVSEQPQMNYGNMNGLIGMGTAQSSSNGSNPMNMGASNPGLPRPITGSAPNGAPANLTFEMMQSFMQRNAESGQLNGPQ